VFVVVQIKTVGDAYFVVSYRHENNAESIVRMGLGMIRVIKRINEKRKFNLNIRIGCATGEATLVVLGNIQTRVTFDCFGRAVRLAQILEQTGKPGAVHTCEDTAIAVADLVDLEEAPRLNDEYFNDTPTFTVLGKKQAVSNVEVLVAASDTTTPKEAEIEIIPLEEDDDEIEQNVTVNSHHNKHEQRLKLQLKPPSSTTTTVVLTKLTHFLRFIVNFICGSTIPISNADKAGYNSLLQCFITKPTTEFSFAKYIVTKFAGTLKYFTILQFIVTATVPVIIVLLDYNILLTARVSIIVALVSVAVQFVLMVIAFIPNVGSIPLVVFISQVVTLLINTATFAAIVMDKSVSRRLCLLHAGWISLIMVCKFNRVIVFCFCICF